MLFGKYLNGNYLKYFTELFSAAERNKHVTLRIDLSP